MARKKRRKPSSSQQQPSHDDDDRFHTPFGDLKTLLRGVGSPVRPPPEAGCASNAPAPPASPVQESIPQTLPKAPRRRSTPQAPSDVPSSRERALFLAEMTGVKRLSGDRRGYVEKHRQVQPQNRRLADELDALADLRNLVEGRGSFTIQYTDEYMEGVAPGVDRRLAQRLHSGDFAVQAHLDLHGHTVDEAKDAVDRLLTQAYTSGRRCVRLVHGRGRNSVDHRPVLKEQVQLWLSHGRLSRLVLAFATAPSTDGGAGAVYVLLRRGPYASRRPS